jgi:hypothetical protein
MEQLYASLSKISRTERLDLYLEDKDNFDHLFFDVPSLQDRRRKQARLLETLDILLTWFDLTSTTRSRNSAARTPPDLGGFCPTRDCYEQC